eukprot:3403057-Amphidinium_carterae.1
MARTGLWLPLHVLNASGERLEIVLKGSVYQDEGAWWDLYEPLHYLVRNKTLKIGKLLGHDFSAIVSLLGGLDGAHLSRSRRASNDPTTSQEYTADTYGLLRFILWFSLERRYVSDKERGRALFDAFLSAAVSPDLCPQPSSDLPLELRQLCQVEVTALGCCSHLSACIQESRDAAVDNPPQLVSVKWVRSLAALPCKCSAAMRVMEHVLFEASLVIDMVALLGDLASTDVRESLRGREVQQQKRRRIDEDVRQHLLGLGASRHESASASGTRLRVHVESNVKASWIARKLRQQLEHLWCQGEKTGDLVISMDGVRIGSPGEETY